MMQVLEVPRRLTIHVLGVLMGGFFLYLAWLFVGSVRPELGQAYRWIVTAVLVAIGARAVLANAWAILWRRPVLRASSDGVWFGGGPMIAWRDIESVYQPAMRPTMRRTCVAFSFCQSRTLFRLPPWLWLTSLALGDVMISVIGSGMEPTTVIARLDALRAGAVASGATELPRAELRS